MTVTVFGAHDIYLKTQKQYQSLANKYVISNIKMIDGESREYVISYSPEQTDSKSSRGKPIKYFQLQREITSCLQYTRDLKDQI